MIPERGPQTAKRELERERNQTGQRDHGTKPVHRTGPPHHRFWTCRTHKLSQAGDEARGQTGARRDHGTDM